MKIKSVASSVSLALLFCQTSFAASTFFNVNASGTILTITTNVPNHTYPSAGIRINSPSNFSPHSGCTQQSNGFCTFSVSNTTPASIGINGSTTTMNITLCLNGLGPLSCQDYNVSVTGPVLYASTKYGVVEVSTNRGASWTPTNQPGGNPGNGLWMYNNVIYMGSSAGNVEKSTNNGTSWSATGAQPDGAAVLSVFNYNGILYAGTADGNLAISSNDGSTWSLTTPPAPVSGSVNAPVAGIYVSGNTIYIATNNGGDSSYNYVKVSTDGGTTWRDITPTSTPPGPSIYYTAVFLANNTLYAATNNAEVYTTSLPLPPTSPSWTLHNSGASIGLHALYVQAGTPNNTLYSAGDGNIPESIDNGSSWNTDLNVPGSSGSYGIYLNGNTLYTSTAEGNLLYHNITTGGSDWTSSTQQPGGDLPYGLFISSNGTMYVGGSNGEVSFSSNGGQTWSGTSITGSLSPIYATLIQGDTIYAGDSDGNFLQYNGSWTSLSNVGSAILSLAANGSTLYEGDFNGFVKASINGGTTWSTGTQPDTSGVSSLAAISGSANLYAGTKNGNVEISTDGGNIWSATDNKPDGSAVNGLAIDTSTTPYTLYAGTANGNVEISTDGGQTWSATPSKPDGYAVLGLVTR